MTRTLQLLRGTTAQNNAFTGAAGEVTVDTDTNELRVHDGSTAGGFAVAKKSAIPTVNNATLTIQKNGTTVNTFTANASSDVTANITVPTNTNELTNGAGFITGINSSDVTTALGYTPANISLSNLNSTGKNLGNWSTNISNCITEIPQDINLTLSNGTLTLKEGSKVYHPNGNTNTAPSDKTETAGLFSDGKYFVITGNALFINFVRVDKSCSGTTDSLAGTPNHLWYDTSDNTIKEYYNNGTDFGTRAFPLAIITISSGAITSIDQVFNGFGYIGRKVFALPGVKALVPDGRNTDGTLKSVLNTLSSVKTSDGYTSKFMFNATGISPASYTNYAEQDTQPSFTNGAWYNPSENKMYQISNGVASVINSAYVLDVVLQDANHVKSITPKLPFRAVDYSDWNAHRLVAFQNPTSSNDYKWYRKYSDGWVEQGGIVPATTNNDLPVTLPIAMADANYTLSISIICASNTNDVNWAGAGARSKSSTGFTTYAHTTFTKDWVVYGYAA